MTRKFSPHMKLLFFWTIAYDTNFMQLYEARYVFYYVFYVIQLKNYKIVSFALPQREEWDRSTLGRWKREAKIRKYDLTTDSSIFSEISTWDKYGSRSQQNWLFIQLARAKLLNNNKNCNDRGGWAKRNEM